MGRPRSGMPRRLVSAGIALVTLAGVAGCGNDGGTADATTATTGDATISAGPLGFSATAVGGGTIDFAGLAGEPVALWFWAPS